MGERGQLQIGKVYLYTHWEGDKLKETLKTALSRKERWDDEEYLARIIFCEMVKGSQDETTGYGIGTQQHNDLNYPLLVIDVKNQKVWEKETDYSYEPVLLEQTSFEEFIKCD
mgnify:CR=1 FL=1